MIENNIISPITQSTNVELIESISTKSIIEAYHKYFKINVEKYFEFKKEVFRYRCWDSGYEFYYPFNISGDSHFYEILMKKSWYYIPWKWEHEIAANQIQKTDKVLEIGCGKGSFLEKIKENCLECTGLELNQVAIKEALKKELKVIPETIQEHSVIKSEYYDLVCSFQVLEHIYDVIGFIKSSLLTLKKGGKLIISVPNNDSFIKFDKNNFLNMPPHHLGLWNQKSLEFLVEIFEIKLDKIYLEPLQDYHFLWYINSLLQRKMNLSPIIRKTISLFIYPFLYLFLRQNRNKITGHTIQVVYTKK